MKAIGVRELKARTSDVIRCVREEGQSYVITYRGRAVAHLLPADAIIDEHEEELLWSEIDELAKEIGKKWPKGISAAEAVSDLRR